MTQQPSTSRKRPLLILLVLSAMTFVVAGVAGVAWFLLTRDDGPATGSRRGPYRPRRKR